MGQGDDEERVWSCRCNLQFHSYEERHAHECPPTKDEQLIKELNELVADFIERSEENPIWEEAAQELKWILGDQYEELLPCGCPPSEFGCQGYHGV